MIGTNSLFVSFFELKKFRKIDIHPLIRLISINIKVDSSIFIDSINSK